MTSRPAYYSRGRTLCSIDGCETHVATLASGYCNKHNYKFVRYGDPLGGRTYKQRGDGHTYTTRGYVVIVGSDGAKQYQHRMVMEEGLGRPLAPHENVHHINGVRGDNRPENLELWVKPQPQGQRLSDLLEWLVDTYPAEVMELLDSEEIPA